MLRQPRLNGGHALLQGLHQHPTRTQLLISLEEEGGGGKEEGESGRDVRKRLL